MATIVVGTHTCEIVQTTTAHSTTGAYSFSTDAGTISGTIYKHAASSTPLPSCLVYLLKSPSADEYMVYAGDDYWGHRGAPYPLQGAPFTQDIELGFEPQIRLRDVTNPESPVWMDGAHPDIVLTVEDYDGKVTELVVGGGQGTELGVSGAVMTPFGTGPADWALTTGSTDEEDGRVRIKWPAPGRLILPNGEGAQARRYFANTKDYRDGSDETEATGITSFAITGARLLYRGFDYDVGDAFEGTPQTLDWGWGSITVTGGSEDGECYLGSPTEAQLSDHETENGNWSEGGIQDLLFDANGEAPFVDLPPGEYLILAHSIWDETDYVGIGTVTLDPYEQAETTLSWTANYYEEAGEGYFGEQIWGLYGHWYKDWEVPLANAALYVRIRYEEWDEEQQDYVYQPDVYWQLGTTDANGWGKITIWGEPGHPYDHVEYGDIFTNDAAWGWHCCSNHDGIGCISGGNIVAKSGSTFNGFGGGTRTGEGQSTFINISPPVCGLWVGPNPDQDPLPAVPAAFNHVPMVPGGGIGRLRTKEPVPAYGGQINDSELEAIHIEWNIYRADGSIVNTITLPHEDQVVGPDWRDEDSSTQWACNWLMYDVPIGARIKGGVMRTPLTEIGEDETARAADLGLEYGTLPIMPALVSALRVGPTSLQGEDYSDGASGMLHGQCPYCGLPPNSDPGAGAWRWFCASCGDYNVLSDGETFFATAPVGIAQGGSDPTEITRHTVRVIEPLPQALSRIARDFTNWYRGECYWEDSLHEVTDAGRYGVGSPRVAHHVGVLGGATDGMATWDHATGYADGYDLAEWLAYEQALSTPQQDDRGIGFVQPKCEILEVLGGTAELRVEAARTGGTNLYYYGTLSASHALGHIVKFRQVLPNTASPESERRALASVYAADGDAAPFTAADVCDEIVGIMARESESDEWSAAAAWLATGQIRIVNDGPSIRGEGVYTTTPHWTHFLAHLFVEGALSQPHLFHDNVVKWLFFINSGDVYWRRDESWEDLGSDETCKEYGRATSDGQSAWPWADKDEAGRIVLVREYGGNSIYVQISDDNARTWSADVTLASGESPRALLHDRRLYVTRISGGMGQVARTPVDDYEQLDTWPDDTTWADVAASDDPVPVDKSESGEVVFAVTSGGAIDIYVSDIDGQSAA